MKLLPLLALALCSCGGYTQPYISPHPYVQGPLPYDGPSKVTVIDHGPVPAGIFVHSTPSYYQRDYTPYCAPRTNYYNTYPSYGYRPYSNNYNYGHNSYHHNNYCAPRVQKGTTRSYFSGSDYGYSSYREHTRRY